VAVPILSDRGLAERTAPALSSGETRAARVYLALEWSDCVSGAVRRFPRARAESACSGRRSPRVLPEVICGPLSLTASGTGRSGSSMGRVGEAALMLIDAVQ
jgi:hypothetical protein